MSTQTKSGRRTVLKDNSWIRRNAEEDEPVDHDPNFGKVVLSQQRSVDDVSSKPVEAEKPPVNSGTSISSLSKRFSGSQELLNKSSTTTTNTKSAVTVPPSPSKPPVPAKNPVLKTPNTSSFTARVFSGANTSSKTLSPVKPSFGEKFPEVTASQTSNGQDKSSSAGPSASVTVSPSAAPSITAPSTGVKSSAVTTPVKSPSRSESVSVSTLVSTSSTPSAQTTVTNTKTSSWTLDETPATRPAETPSASPKLSDVSYSPSAVTVNSRYTYQTPSAPLDDLADTLLPSLSGGVQSQPVRSQTQVKTVYTESPAASPTLRSPLQTTLESSSRSISSRDVCTVCGKPIAGAERMILEELKIISHTSCFRCAVCHCDLGGLEAGMSLWVHRERVNCSNCFSKIRGQWYI
ncbi:hypothetical protein ABG768_024585 [Culter alburnus]|uniref:LIM zinc-binding domain-containing protein n=1 Tax=Culter alburnus TaxID=194366 RepID=A0AAW2AKF4_CULAL